MKNYIKLFAFAAISLSLVAVSCKMVEEEVFEKSPSARMQECTDNIRTILTSSEAGWVMDAFPGTAGACCYFLKFTDKEVTAWFEKDPQASCTSLYAFRYDNGPVLSFDTYNEILAYFAIPSSAHYEAFAGDFEFSIMDYDNDKIRLLGKRSGLYHTLYRADGSKTPEQYMEAVYDLSEGFRASTLEGKIGDLDVKGSVDLEMRILSLSYETEEEKENEDGVMEMTTVTKTEEMRFNFTPDGMRLYEEMEMNGYKFDYLWYLPENNILTNGVFTLQGKLPDDYMPYSAFEGNFTLTYNTSKTFAVTLTPEPGGYVMSGMNSNYVVHLTYDKGLGRLHWKTQVVGSNGSNSVYLCAWSLSVGGSLTWDTNTGVTIHWVAENNQFEFEDDGCWEGKPVDSFILWEVSSAGSVGQFTGWGSAQIPYLKSLKRR